MKFLIPKSHRIKHKILEFLSKERMKNGGLNQTKDFTFPLKEISTRIGERFSDVYTVSDYLFYKKLVYFTKNGEDVENPKCWVSDDGIELYTSFSLINDGKILNTTLYSNLTSIIFTIILGSITMFTVYSSDKNTKEIEKKVNELEKRNLLNEQRLLNLSKALLNEKKSGMSR
ncbi:hypothetical protein KBJ98_02705 [Flavobacterium sp. F-328]|uniref:Uncharacterized protein n=1 Tax=Flavobacterium erciyesense TaxID=2825842 RepID=A0ABS5D0R5_9FLAO|nr:hypothetical protein [Flavobacterium erciyesense]MBQ0907608.1 hypothetical protein [Flavobacterium erciyesense]